MEPRNKSKTQSPNSIYFQSVAATLGFNTVILSSWLAKEDLVVQVKNIEPKLEKSAANIFDFTIISTLILGNIVILIIFAQRIRKGLKNLGD